MNQQLIPARIVTPGRILSRELAARGWTQKDLAEIIARPEQTISAIINAKKEITPETAIELAAAFDIPAEFWTNLETNYRLHLAKKKHDNAGISRRSRLYAIAPVSELIKHQWLPKTQTIEELEKAVCEFLGIPSSNETPKLIVNFRHNNDLEPEEIGLISWTKQVEHLSKKQTVANFDRATLEAAIPELLNYAQNIEDISKVPNFLMSMGVHFVVVPHLSQTYLDGATFTIDDNPVIALTLRYNRVDAFWFTLMHELGHLVAGHTGIFIDDLKNLADNPQENEANQFARNWLINPDDLAQLIETCSHRYSQVAIEEFAASQKRHPGIIVGRLQHEKEISYKNHRQYLVKVDKFLSEWFDKS
jgi:HTH-type transcriptional regulator/antitoxin HigA